MKINDDNSIEFEHEYDVVLIIGNGFDLNYKLPTSYNDFIKTDYFISLIGNDNSLAKYLQDKHQLHNWIDIENELKTYANSKSTEKTKFFEDFKDISNALSDYLSKIRLDTLDRENLGYKLLKNFKNKDTLIIDFNYTNTISILLKDFEEKDGHRFDHVKIHGTTDQNNIIFGIEDKARVPSNYVFLKKSVNKNFKAIDFSYKINNCEFLGIFGHSLGETDHMYFKDFFYEECIKDNGNKRNIVIFHYGEKSYYDIFSQLDILTSNKIYKLKQNNKLKLIDTKK